MHSCFPFSSCTHRYSLMFMCNQHASLSLTHTHCLKFSVQEDHSGPGRVRLCFPGLSLPPSLPPSLSLSLPVAFSLSRSRSRPRALFLLLSRVCVRVPSCFLFLHTGKLDVIWHVVTCVVTCVATCVLTCVVTCVVACVVTCVVTCRAKPPSLHTGKRAQAKPSL